MPRNAQGQYFLPDGNPVVPGELIKAEWANSTMDDIANALTESLDRAGFGGMTAPLKCFAGTAGRPGITFLEDVTSGLYKKSNGVVSAVATGVEQAYWSSNGFFAPAVPTTGPQVANKAYVDSTSAAAVNSTAIDAALGYHPAGVNGQGANGTWGISISGNAATATNATNATNAVTATNQSGGTVNASSATINGVLNVNAGGSSQIAANNGNGMIIQNVSNTPMLFYTNNTERMRIRPEGDLLVGGPNWAGKITINQTNVNSYQQGIAFMNPTGDHWNIVYGASNNMYFGFNQGDKAYVAATTGSWNPISDRRAKKNIEPLTYGLDAILELSPVSYQMIGEENSSKRTIGLIAQEVKAVIDEAVDDQPDPEKMYGLDKSVLVPVLIKAIQEQQQQIKTIKSELDLLKGKLGDK